MENAKAYAALVGSVCTALLGVFTADTPVGQVLTVLSVVATAVATWAVPNQPQGTSLNRNEVGQVQSAVIWALAVVGIVLLVLLLVGVLR